MVICGDVFQPTMIGGYCGDIFSIGHDREICVQFVQWLLRRFYELGVSICPTKWKASWSY